MSDHPGRYECEGCGDVGKFDSPRPETRRCTACGGIRRIREKREPVPIQSVTVPLDIAVSETFVLAEYLRERGYSYREIADVLEETT